MQPDAKEHHDRVIIHVDMDCFFAAIEIRERPELADKPVAVGGSPKGRGVLTTCNYVARKYGCRSAMPAFKALEICPNLIILPVRHDLYRHVSYLIRKIFYDFTQLVEPLSLDEAFLDVSALNSSGPSIAQEIRYQTMKTTGLTASAGIAPNKMLAKIASDWNKPNGQHHIRPDSVNKFMQTLPVRMISGVGGKTDEKLSSLGIKNCGQLQSLPLTELHQRFGKFGAELFELCRGIDNREVNPSRERKSASTERTFRTDLATVEEGLVEFGPILSELQENLTSKYSNRRIRSTFVKLKFSNFQQTTAERSTNDVSIKLFEELIEEAWRRGGGKAVRLIGAGVRFAPKENKVGAEQLELFP